jgi:hypothetical protein
VRVHTVARIPVRGRRLTSDAIRDWDGVPLSRPHLDEWVARRLLAGMHPTAAVLASGSAMSARTAYRWRKELVALEVVELDGRQATFAIRRTQPPARISPWRPCARAEAAS